MNGSGQPEISGWRWESLSFAPIFRTFNLATHPSKMVLAVVALLLTWGWGSLLDVIWSAADQDAAPGEIWMHAAGQRLDDAGDAAEGADRVGVFHLWRRHSAACIESGMSSLRHGRIWGTEATALTGIPSAVSHGVPLQLGLVPAGQAFLQGTGWLVSRHFWFAFLFFLGAIGIWALFGGGICRIAAVQFARGEKIGPIESLRFAASRYFSGFLLAPMWPVIMLFVIAIALGIGGLIFRIPYVGDLVGGLFFGLALLIGLGAAMILIGVAAGGSLFWPSVAAEGNESLDAVSRSFNYVFAHPWRTILYGLVAMVYGSLCYLFVRVLAFLALKITHVLVGYGTAPFGWWKTEEGLSKLELVWASPTLMDLHPAMAFPGGMATVAAVLVGIWVGIVILLVWGFLASFYLSASTVIYFLLRRDTDAMDLEDVFIEAYEEGDFEPSPAPPEPSADSGQLLQISKPKQSDKPEESEESAEDDRSEPKDEP